MLGLKQKTGSEGVRGQKKKKRVEASAATPSQKGVSVGSGPMAWCLMRREIGRPVGVDVGLPSHHWEVQGSISLDNPILELRIGGCAGSAQAHVPVR